MTLSLVLIPSSSGLSVFLAPVAALAPTHGLNPFFIRSVCVSAPSVFLHSINTLREGLAGFRMPV